MKINLSGVDKVIYINLKSREDRRESITNELRRLGVPESKIIRFEAIESAKGYIGCTLSHLKILKLAEQEAWGDILIIEDDMEFNCDFEHISKANEFIAMLQNRDWDVAMLAGNYFNVQPLKCNRILLKIIHAFCACAYLVNRNYRAKLIEILAEAVSLLDTKAEQRYAIDSYWTKFMPDGNWLGLYPCLGHQKADYSDIQKYYVNYQHLFYKPLSKIQTDLYCPAGKQGCISTCYYRGW